MCVFLFIFKARFQNLLMTQQGCNTVTKFLLITVSVKWLQDNRKEHHTSSIQARQAVLCAEQINDSKIFPEIPITMIETKIQYSCKEALIGHCKFYPMNYWDF